LLSDSYGVQVHGVDLSTNMLGIAKTYREQMEPEVKHR
jgi:cyclopropane fatty-acyl-phospholipid synthase-like methyltransferase